MRVWKICEDPNCEVLAARVGQEQIDQHNANSKARSVIFSSLSLSEFERVSDCTTAREIWVRLQSYYEGTVQVKTKLFKTYKSEYENFSVGWRVYRCHVFSLSIDCEQDAGKQVITAL